MVNNKFQDELDKLEQLLNKLNKKNNNKQNKRSQRGGDMDGALTQLASTEASQEEHDNSQTGAGKKKKSVKKTVKKNVKKTVKKGKKSQRGGAEDDVKAEGEEMAGGRRNNNRKRTQRGGAEHDNSMFTTEEERGLMMGGAKKKAKKTVKKTVKKTRKSHKGGAMMDERPARHFVVVMVNGKEVKEEDAPKIKLYLVTKTGKLNKQGPRDAASKAFSKLCRKYGKKEECSLSFSIRETTRASEFELKGKKYKLRGENKHHNYQGKRVKLSKAEQEATKRKLKNGKFIINMYRNELKSKGMEKTKHQKGGWAFYS
jgi:hypothetical protein